MTQMNQIYAVNNPMGKIFLTSATNHAMRGFVFPNHDPIYTVKRGNTLTNIAKAYYGQQYGWLYIKIQQANPNVIKNPNIIYVGTQIKIPFKYVAVIDRNDVIHGTKQPNLPIKYKAVPPV